MEGPEIDVISVHQSAFARCCEAVATVRARPHSASVLVYGESGSGKTHLLARLRARVAGEETAPGVFRKPSSSRRHCAPALA